MALMQEWLLAVLAAAFLTAAAQAVMPEGAVKEVGRLICGLLLFLAVARPLLGVSYQALERSVASYTQSLAQAQEALEETGEQLTEEIIARETDAYIQDKREELGLDFAAEVTWDWSGETPVPSQVTVTGELTGQAWQTVSEALAEDLGLEAGQITLAEEEEP